jgi:hypothetical protein
MSFLGDIASSGVGAIMSGIGTLAKDLRQAITGDLPAEKQAEIQQKLMELELKAMEGQMAINMEEAKSEHLFVAGWRPFVGWIGGFSLAYAAILEPFMSWCARVYGSTVVFPVLDTTITMQVLFGILGLGAFRSYDKSQSPAPKGKE